MVRSRFYRNSCSRSSETYSSLSFMHDQIECLVLHCSLSLSLSLSLFLTKVVQRVCRKEKGHRCSPIPPPPHPTYDLYAVIDAALQEDAGDAGDITTESTIHPNVTATATFMAKAHGTVAGIYVATAVFARVDSSVNLQWKIVDGSVVQPGDILGVARGNARSILIAERVALNFMQRMSGIATFTASMVSLVSGTGATILDTRKTVPGLRLLDKWAVAIGGGKNHRMGLYDMFMIKDNHIAAAGGIAAALEAVEEYMRLKGINKPLEIETRSLEELQSVLQILDSNPNSCITRIMLDNMTKRNKTGSLDVSLLQQAIEMIGERAVETEASGNVMLDTVAAIARTGVQFISCGALTHSVKSMDISLNIETDK